MLKRRSLLWEIVQTILMVIVVYIVVRLLVQNFRVDGISMEPNFHNNEYLLVNKVVYDFHGPERGDVIVFRAVSAGQPNDDFIKRVIGLPGETVAVQKQTVYINGHPLAEPYIPPSSRPAYTFPPMKVPKDSYFVLGDNRNESYDSHSWHISHWVPKGDIIGEALIAYWPLSDFHLI